MISTWTKHLSTEDEKARFKNSVLSSKLVLERLQELIKEVETEVDYAELSTKQYAVPNWDYMQADRNGFRRALKTINRIITIDQ